MSKKKKKKKGKIKKLLLSIIVILILIFVSIMLGAYVFDIKFSTVTVTGNNIITNEEIMETIFENGNYTNYYLTSSKDIEKKLKDNQMIKDVKIKKNLLFELEIEIEENTPLFIREDTNKIVLNTGEEIDNIDKYNLNIPTLINYVPNTKYKVLIEKLTKIDEKIVAKISEIKYYPNKYDEDRFVLYMNDSNMVFINLPKFKSLNKYNEMVSKFEGKTGTLYLDSGNYFKADK